MGNKKHRALALALVGWAAWGGDGRAQLPDRFDPHKAQADGRPAALSQRDDGSPGEKKADPGGVNRAVGSLLLAMADVESGHDRFAVGDGGRAIGVYQIHRLYWKDSGVPGRWEDCRDPAYAQRVVLAYWRRYCPIALGQGNLEILSRIHNGGPRGHVKRKTARYWREIRLACSAAAPAGTDS